MKKYTDKEIEDMYERNVNRLYKIAYTYFYGNESNIEDAIQDIFLKVIDKNIKFKTLEHEKAWFIVALQNKCKNMLKSKWNQTTELNFDIKQEEQEDETIELVMQLPNDYKVPLYMFYYEGYSCIEIAKLLHKPENTIYSYLSRARKMLKIEMESEQDA